MAARTANDKPNIRHVAERAGVSHMTVSRVLNGHPNIRPATRERVLAAIDELAYRPSSAARTLASQRSRCIGVIVDSAVEFGPTSTLRAIEAAARYSSYSVVSVSLRDDDQLSPEEALARLSAQGVDALCIIAPRSSSLAALRRLDVRVPMLVISATDDPLFHTLSVDQSEGARLAVRHLVELGHRELLHVAGPLDWVEARARERAFRDEIRAQGLRERPIVVGDWTADFGYDYARTGTGMPPYTAIFAANDEMALGIIHGFAERGIRVPQDVSIVGFDDIPTARHFLPPLTTVVQDFHTLGTRAMAHLVQVLSDGVTPEASPFIPVDLVVRSSTSPPRD